MIPGHRGFSTMTIRRDDTAGRLDMAAAIAAIEAAERRRSPVFAGMSDPPADAGWHIVHGAPLVARNRIADLRDKGIAPPVRLFVPMERVAVSLGRGRRQRVRDLPLFGPYFFAQMDLARDSREAESLAALRLAAFKTVDGVGRFVGVDANGWPRAIDMRGFQQVFDAPVVERKGPTISVGDAVKMLSGAFAGLEGNVCRVLGRLDRKQRVVVMLRMFGGSSPTEVPLDHVAPIARAG